MDQFTVDMTDVEHPELDKLREALLYKRIVDFTPDSLTLDNGQVLKLKMLDSDCCAYADGTFEFVKLDAMITDVQMDNPVYVVDEYEDNESTARCKLKIYNNLNPVAQAELTANNGNCGYYYSVAGAELDDETFMLLTSGF